jgi:hypothetical protein
MIVVEEIEIDGIKFRKTVSDSGFYITRDGAKYAEAIDPIEFTDRIYTETDEKIPVDGHLYLQSNDSELYVMDEAIDYENQYDLIEEDGSNMEDPRH